MDKNIIGDKIRLARLTRKPILRQKDLLAKLDLQGLYLSESTLSKIESGTRNVSDFEVVAIAEALGVSVLWLLGIEK